MGTSNPILVVEGRDEVLRAVHWVALDYAKREKLWSTQPDKKEWWRHLDDVTSNLVVLRKFESTLNPDQTYHWMRASGLLRGVTTLFHIPGNS